jgi:hypothetical protein
VFIHFDPGLPSGADVEVVLARGKITSKKGTPFTGPDHHTLTTAPFSVEADFKDGDALVPDAAIKLAFSNVPGASIADAVTVTAGGAPVAIDVMKSAENATVRVVKPQGGAWPVGADYKLTVGMAAGDLFGVKVAAPLAMGFSVARTADGGAPDAPASSDGGAADAGIPSGDGGSDGADGP